jgi:hypothetical protein
MFVGGGDFTVPPSPLGNQPCQQKRDSKNNNNELYRIYTKNPLITRGLGLYMSAKFLMIYKPSHSKLAIYQLWLSLLPLKNRIGALKLQDLAIGVF